MHSTPDTAPSASSPHGRPAVSQPDVHRHTRGRCDRCLADVPAAVVQDAAGAWLCKYCPEHGESRQLLSRHPAHWLDLDRYFFRVHPTPNPQRDFMVRVTERCNLDCPICLAKANTEDTPDLDLEHLARLLEQRRGVKVDLLAAEPTLRDDLEEWIRRVKASGNIAALHTNGLKLADRDYVQRLADAGVDEVFLQFDGFDDRAHRALRGADLTRRRLRALGNLRDAGIGTSLIVVVARGLNEEQIGEVYRFALHPENHFIREVFFLGLRLLGSARDRLEQGHQELADAALMPDELVDMLVEQVPEIRRPDIRRFNKLYFAMLSAFGVRKCSYIHHYLVARDPQGGARTAAELLDLPALEGVCERYAQLLPEHPQRARFALARGVARAGMSPKLWPMLADLLRLNLLFRTGMKLNDVPERFLLLGFITACDPANFDQAVSDHCGKGELSADGGLHESGALANVEREARFARTDRRPGRRFGAAR